MLEKNVYSPTIGYKVLFPSIVSTMLIVLFRYSIFLLVSYILKPPTEIMDNSISPCNSVNFLFSIFLVFKFRIAIVFW